MYVLIIYYCVHLCFSKQEFALCFSLSKPRYPIDQLNPHHVPTKKTSEDWKFYRWWVMAIFLTLCTYSARAIKKETWNEENHWRSLFLHAVSCATYIAKQYVANFLNCYCKEDGLDIALRRAHYLTITCEYSWRYL